MAYEKLPDAPPAPAPGLALGSPSVVEDAGGTSCELEERDFIRASPVGGAGSLLLPEALLNTGVAFSRRNSMA